MQRSLLVIGILCGWHLNHPAPILAQADGAEVVAVVEQFFTGMRTKDSTMIRGTVDPLARLILVTPQGEARALSLGDFIQRVTTGQEVFDEKIFEPEVRIDGSMATLWAAYDILIDGTFSHCGFDAFQLSKLATGWKITQISDSRTRQGCTSPRAPR